MKKRLRFKNMRYTKHLIGCLSIVLLIVYLLFSATYLFYFSHAQTNALEKELSGPEPLYSVLLARTFFCGSNLFLRREGDHLQQISKQTSRKLHRQGVFRRYLPVYLILLPSLVLIFIFMYIPMGGLITAFKDFSIFKGFWKSPWAANYGLANFQKVFANQELLASVGSTVYLSLLNLLVSFPTPILLALSINELKRPRFKKTVQTISYMPHFLSWISVIGLATAVFSEYGTINDLMNLIWGEDRKRILYLSQQQNFVPIMVLLNLWKTIGWNSIIYIAAITAIDPQLYEAAMVDGAGRWAQTCHITLPGISTTIILLFVMNIGSVMSSNFDLVFGLQNPFINFDTIDTVIYKYGLKSGNYSVSTALGLVRGLIALALTLGVNQISKKVNDVSIV